MTEPTPPAVDAAAALAARLRGALADIAGYWHAMLPQGVTQRPTGTIGRSPDAAAPIHAHILDARRETLEQLHFYARVVLAERSGHYEMPGRVALDVPALARFLGPHVDWLADHELADAATEDITTAARKVRAAAAPQGREQQHFVGPCECGERIHAPAGQTLIVCPTCAREWDRHHLRENARAALRQQLYTAAEAAAAARAVDLDVKAPTIRKWVQREKITPMACDIVSQAHRFRFGDVEALARPLVTASTLAV